MSTLTLPRLTRSGVLLSLLLALLFRHASHGPSLAIAPMLLAGLMSAAPGLLSKLFGSDPQQKLRKQLMSLMSPERMQALTNQFYQQGLGSPMFSQAQRQIAGGANTTSNQIAQKLAQSGMGSSGTGAIMSSITPSIVGGQQAGVRSALYQGAQGQVQNSLQQQIQALLGTSGPSQSTQMFGAGMEAFMPFLQQWLGSRMGGGGGGLGNQMNNMMNMSRANPNWAYSQPALR